ncbi:MAG: hypothetical protein HFE81_01660, partial [Bacilli bacterium]|nr:hypothetical protein [Bacilli bacterium]
NYKSLKKYDSIILPNIYIEEFDMSGYSYKNSREKIDFYKEYILSRKIKFKVNSNVYEISFNDLGITVDEDKTIEAVKEFQNKLSYSKKLRFLNGKEKNKFKFIYKVDDQKLVDYLNNLKATVDVAAVDGYFDTSDGVKYVKGVDGYALNVGESGKIVNEFLTNIDYKKEIELIGDLVASNTNESYQTIDTMTSSFMTKFNVWEGTRPTNLRTALNYINGAVVESGEVFSYYKYAGPYNKKGYVFYYEFVGNGVCQIATTVYDAALLGGLEIVKRYPHAKKSVYVDGGLDATVASYSSGWHVDFQFKNTYKYPIYIKAYANGGEAHVEFWSNSNAKEGKTYSTESVQIGARGYKTFLHTYKDGVEIDKSEIATTWYTEG